MVVNITKYPTHRWYHNFLYNVFGYKNEQAIYVQIDEWDTWSMDHTLAHIVAPMLIQLRDTTHSFNTVDIEDRPEHLIGTLPATNSHEPDEFAEQAWDWVITEMIFAFESKHEDWEEQFYSGESDITWEPVENSDCFELVNGPNHTFEIDMDGMKKYQERITNGFRLFGKYYEGLWD